MPDYTAHFHIPIPDFDTIPWHQGFEDALRGMDTAMHLAILGNAAAWTNSTAYVITNIVIDPTDGTLWICKVAHTSAASPTTFATDRTNNPTFWQPSAVIPAFRGPWVTATSYTNNDFVVNGLQYAVCIVPHVSGVFATDVAAGKWTVLVDVSTTDIGINRAAIGDITAAATTTLANVSATRMRLNGTFGNISSFGVGTNLFKILEVEANGNTLVHSAALECPDGVNLPLFIGDRIAVYSDGSSNWCVWGKLSRQATTTNAGIAEVATAAEAQAMTDVTKMVTADNLDDVSATQADMESMLGNRFVWPSRLHFHPAVPKYWGRATNAGVLSIGYNMSSVTDNGTGDITWTINVDLASSTAHVPVTDGLSAAALISNIVAVAAGTMQQKTWDAAGAAADPSIYTCIGMGDLP